MTTHIKTIDVHNLKSKIDLHQGYLIDVREAEEWEEIRIPGAIHIPQAQLTSLVERLVQDKITPIYLLCRGGVRSLYAAQSLNQLGYEEVYSVDGGIIAWAMSSYPVES